MWGEDEEVAGMEAGVDVDVSVAFFDAEGELAEFGAVVGEDPGAGGGTGDVEEGGLWRVEGEAAIGMRSAGFGSGS